MPSVRHDACRTSRITDAIPVSTSPPFSPASPAAERTAAAFKHINETVGFLFIVTDGVDLAMVEATFAASALLWRLVRLWLRAADHRQVRYRW